jgi:hypothetical protein
MRRSSLVLNWERGWGRGELLWRTPLELEGFSFFAMSDQQQPSLTFDGKKYDFNSLSDEAKGAVKALRVADAQMRMQEDNLRILAIGRKAIVDKLSSELSNVTPIEVL